MKLRCSRNEPCKGVKRIKLIKESITLEEFDHAFNEMLKYGFDGDQDALECTALNWFEDMCEQSGFQHNLQPRENREDLDEVLKMFVPIFMLGYLVKEYEVANKLGDIPEPTPKKKPSDWLDDKS